MGDVDALTVQEYQSLSFWGRLRYRTYRHPLVMFGIDQSAFVVTPGRNAGAQLITFIQTPVLCQTQYATSLGRVAAHSLDRCD